MPVDFTKYKVFNVDGKIGLIPLDKATEFVKKYPKAIEMKPFNVDGKIAIIPNDKVKPFRLKYKNAKPLWVDLSNAKLKTIDVPRLAPNMIFGPQSELQQRLGNDLLSGILSGASSMTNAVSGLGQIIKEHSVGSSKVLPALGEAVLGTIAQKTSNKAKELSEQGIKAKTSVAKVGKYVLHGAGEMIPQLPAMELTGLIPYMGLSGAGEAKKAGKSVLGGAALGAAQGAFLHGTLKILGNLNPKLARTLGGLIFGGMDYAAGERDPEKIIASTLIGVAMSPGKKPNPKEIAEKVHEDYKKLKQLPPARWRVAENGDIIPPPNVKLSFPEFITPPEKQIPSPEKMTPDKYEEPVVTEKSAESEKPLEKIAKVKKGKEKKAQVEKSPATNKNKNPYMKMPIERVRADADNGVRLAQEALKLREKPVNATESASEYKPTEAIPKQKKVTQETKEAPNIDKYEALAQKIDPNDKKATEDAIINFAGTESKEEIQNALDYFKSKIEEAKKEKDFEKRMRYVSAEDMLKQASGMANAPEHVLERVRKIREGKQSKPERKTKTSRKNKAINTLRQWVRSVGGVKQEHLREHGINWKEERGLALQIGASKGKGRSLDDLAKTAIEEKMIPESPNNVNPTDWFIQHLRENKKIGYHLENKAESDLIRSPQYIEHTYNELVKHDAISDDLSKEKFAEMLSKNKEPEKVHTGDLKVGDEFTIAGEKFKVTKQVDDELVIQDGITRKVPDTFDYITIDKGSLKHGKKPLLEEQMAKEQKDQFKGQGQLSKKPWHDLEERKKAYEKKKAERERTGQKDLFYDQNEQLNLFEQKKSTPTKKEISGKDFIKGAIKAISKDLGDQTSLGSNFAGEYKNLREYLKKYRMVLTDKEAAMIMNYYRKLLQSNISKEQMQNEMEKIFARVIEPKKPALEEIVKDAENKKISKTEKDLIDHWLQDDDVKLKTKVLVAQKQAELRHNIQVAQKQMEKEIRFLDKNYTHEQKLEIIDAIESGKEIDDPNIKPLADKWREQLDEAYKMWKDDPSAYLENYFPHIFKNARGISNFLRKWNKSPSFARHRKFPTIKDALDWAKENDVKLGLVTDNPAELVLQRRIAGYQHKMAKETMAELKSNGLIKFVRAGKPIDEGFEPLKTHYFDVFFPSEKGIVLAGRWVALPEAKRVLDNYFSTGLWGRQDLFGDVFRSISKAKNYMLATKFALSGFHLIETGTSSFAMQMDIAIQKALRGKPNILDFGRSIVEPFVALAKGKNIIKAWETGNPYIIKINGKEYDVTKLIERGGGDLKISNQWYNGVQDKWHEAIREFERGHKFKGSLKLIPGILEQISAPIMKIWVPRLKANAYMRMAEEWISAHPNASDHEIDKALFKIWDNVDNAFGELVYDKMFWNRTVKDLMVATQTSLGWNIGTFRMFGGAANDTAKLITSLVTGKKTDANLSRLLYTIPYIVSFGTIGAIITKIMTGKNPKELKDYYYPKTGYKLPDGSEERYQMPTMLKEVMGIKEAYRKGGPIKGIGYYATHKLSPVFWMFIDLLSNKDYYNTQIAEPGADIATNIKNYADYFWKQGVLPISLSSMSKHKERTGKYSVLPIMGFSLAPGYVTKSKAALDIFDMYQQQMGSPVHTKEEFKKMSKLRILKNLIQTNRKEIAKKTFEEYQKQGLISRRTTWGSFYNRFSLPSDIRAFSALTKDRQDYLLNKFDKKDRDKYYSYSKSYQEEIKANSYLYKMLKPYDFEYYEIYPTSKNKQYDKLLVKNIDNIAKLKLLPVMRSNKFRRLSKNKQAFVIYEMMKAIRKASRMMLLKQHPEYKTLIRTSIPRKKKAVIDEILQQRNGG